jgi:glycosyltransferase involved in cell wall biosynthesis
MTPPAPPFPDIGPGAPAAVGASRTFLVDLRVVQYNGDRGIPAYCRSLVRQLCLDHPGHRYRFLWDPRLPQPGWAGEFARLGRWVLEDDVAAGRHGRIDVLLTGCFFLPLWGRGRDYLSPAWLRPHQPLCLGIVYDLIPYLFPERYLATDEARRSYLHGLRLMRRYDRLFAISQATRTDTIRLAGVPPDKVTCVYGDIDHRKRLLIDRGGGGDPAALARHGLRPPYCLYVGGDDWRKNIDGMIAAFARFHARHPDRQLAVVCKMDPERVAHHRLRVAAEGIPPGAVVFTGYVSDEDLVAITRRAEMMAFPSLYEGLGLPVLEAYGCGVPVAGSDTSSIAELLIPELACDPRRPDDLAAAMARLVREPGLRAAALAHGRRVLAGLGWRPAAAAVMATLERPGRAAAAGELAVVAALPPARTAIASYTLAFLQSRSWRTDFFAVPPGAASAATRSLLPGNRLFPAEALAAALGRGRHDTVLFVLGNSDHHRAVLEAALQTRLGCRQRRLAYLHEANLAALLRSHLGAEFEALPFSRPAAGGPRWIRRTLEALPEIGRGLRFLADVADLDGLIVNSHACRDLIRYGLGPAADRWTIDVAFLPIVADLAGWRPGSTGCTDELHVGAFGTGGDSKRLDLVARALALLARDRPVRLSVVGWGAGSQCRRTGIDALPFVEVHDSPDDRRLDELMRGVDVAVQLRVPTHGESSGAVALLLGLGKQVVVTGEGSFAELPRALATCVPADCTAARLAEAIAAAAARRLSRADVARAIDPFSSPAFDRRMAEVLGRPGHAAARRAA